VIARYCLAFQAISSALPWSGFLASAAVPAAHH